MNGPHKAIRVLKDTLGSDKLRASWAEQAYANAILGSCSKSVRCVISGLRCWIEFATIVVKLHERDGLPPQPDHLVMWSSTFRFVDTFSNYLGHVATGCDLVKMPADAIRHPLVKRAKRALRCRMGPPRPKRFIQFGMLKSIVNWFSTNDRLPEAMLFLTAYVFLLRVPSEALPIAYGGVGRIAGQHFGGQTATMFVNSDEIMLLLSSRKNKPVRSRLTRA